MIVIRHDAKGEQFDFVLTPQEVQTANDYAGARVVGKQLPSSIDALRDCVTIQWLGLTTGAQMLLVGSYRNV